MGTHRRWYYQAVAVYDRVFRVWHALDRPAAVVPPALRVESRRAYRTIRLSDGTVIRAGDRVGALHLDNARRRSPPERPLATRHRVGVPAAVAHFA